MDIGEYLLLKNKLAKDGRINCRIISGSMEPLIMTNDFVDIEPLSGELKKFDILVFFQKDKLICHYVTHVNLSDGKIITANLIGGEDLPFEKDQILGKVVNYKVGFWQKLKLLRSRK